MSAPACRQRPAWLICGRIVYDSARDRFARVMAVGRPFDPNGYVGGGSDTAFVVPYPGGGIGWEACVRDLAPAPEECQ